MRVSGKLIFGASMILSIVVPVVLLIVLPVWATLACFVLLIGWLSLTPLGQQTWSVAQVGISTIPHRLGASCVVVVGIAGVVGVFVALLAMGVGLEATLNQTGTDDTAIILESAAEDEISSVLDHDTASIVAAATAVLKDGENQPIASTEVVLVDSVPTGHGGPDTNVEVRGVGAQVWDVRPRIKVISGRKFKAGLREVLVGKSVLGKIHGIEVGSMLALGGQPWSVAGIFDSGDAHNSEIWGDRDVIGPAFHHGSSATSETVRLTDANAFDAFKAEIASNPRLRVSVQTTRQYYSRQSEDLGKAIRILGLSVGAVMAIGAIFGALNTMYAAVAARTREIATLRAIGFGGVPVVASLLIETMLLAVAGAAVGTAIAWSIFDGFQGSSMDISFAFQVSPALLWDGLKWALAIGLIGGIFPAVRAARMAVTAGLREI